MKRGAECTVHSVWRAMGRGRGAPARPQDQTWRVRSDHVGLPALMCSGALQCVASVLPLSLYTAPLLRFVSLAPRKHRPELPPQFASTIRPRTVIGRGCLTLSASRRLASSVQCIHCVCGPSLSDLTASQSPFCAPGDTSLAFSTHPGLLFLTFSGVNKGTRPFSCTMQAQILHFQQHYCTGQTPSDPRGHGHTTTVHHLYSIAQLGLPRQGPKPPENDGTNTH